MKLRRVLPVLVVTVLLAVPAIARAATPDEAAAGLSSRGYYVESGSESVSTARLGDLVDGMARQGYRFLPVLLATDPAAGATAFGDGVLDTLGSGTVLVLTPSSGGWASTEFTSDEVNRAGDLALGAGAADAAFAAFAEALVPGASEGSSQPTNPSTQPAEPVGTSSGGGFPWLLVIVVGGLVALVVFAVRGSGKREKVRRDKDIEEARREIRTQLDAVANEILEEADAVQVSENAEAREYFEAASTTYAEALEQFEKTSNLKDLEAIADRMDEARWQLHASDALRQGRPIPPKPEKEKAGTCFFDPTHKAATEQATLRTSAGDKQVMVCAADAERLRRGEQPQTRMIEVGGRQVPAPMAPRSYGGGGFDWLGAFTMVLAGMARGGAIDMGRRTTARPSARASRREIGVPTLPRMPRLGGSSTGGSRATGGGARVRGGGRRRG